MCIRTMVVANVHAFRSPQSIRIYIYSSICMSRFGPILGTPESESKIGIERGVRVWAPFDAVLSDRSDPRRFRSLLGMIY